MKVKGTAEYKLNAWSEHKSRLRFPDLWFQNMEYTIFGRRMSNKTNLLSYLLTYSKEQIPSSEANQFSANQEILRILWNPKVYYCIRKCPPPVQSMPPHPTSWRSILILSSHLCMGLPSVSFLVVSPPKPCIHLSSPPYMLHALLISHLNTRTISGEG